MQFQTFFIVDFFVFAILSDIAKDYYQILGIEKSASSEDIKKAYRDMSKKWHPDKHKGDKDAETKFKEINEAYEVIGNPKKKQSYDQFGSAGGPGGAGGFDFSGFNGGDFGDLGSIFETFFGGGGAARGGGGRRQQQQRGSDLQTELSIDFAESVSGVQKKVSMRRLRACDNCQGKGAEPGTELKDCSTCNGTGQVTRTAQSFFGTVQQSFLCQTCNGRGKIPEKPCTKCRGEGRIGDSSDLTVDIPAGIADGQTLRISGQGEAGPQGAPAGDLYVRIRVKQDKRFERENDDIHASLTLSVVDAILGTQVAIETVQGKIELKIPEGTQPGQVFRIKGKGMPVLNTGRFGDHFVHVDIEIPKKLSRKERKLVEEWKELL